MSHRQQDYKSRGGRGGGRGGAFQRLGIPLRGGGGDGRYQYRGGGGGHYQRGGRGGDRGGDRGGRGGGRGDYRGRGGDFQHRGGRGDLAAVRHRPSYINQQRNQDSPQKNWFKVVITRGADFEKDFILKALSSYLDRPLWPVLYKTYVEDGNATFFVDDKDTADAIGATSRRVQGPNGQKLNIRVTPNAAPYVALRSDEEDAVKTVLQNRFDAHNPQNLDLSSFNLDSVLQDQRNTNFSLQRNNVMMAVVDLIGNEQPIADQIRSVDVSNNRLRFMDYFACLVPRLPNVTRLILHHNQIDNLSELEKLSGWNLTELDLDQSPLCGKYRDRTNYISDIRSIFPNLIKLDGSDLPAPTKFGLDVVEKKSVGLASLPPFKPSFFVNEDFRNLTSQFMLQYFTCFDAEDRQQRQQLLVAYDDDATFTMSAMNLSAEGHATRGDNWNEITRDSHNILKMEFWERFRQKLVQKGKLAILSYLCNNFPPTKTIFESCIVDISFASENIFCVNVSGVFRDKTGSETVTDEELWPLRFFNRVFLLRKNEQGLCIVNEMLFISTISPNQYIHYSQQKERAEPIVVQESNPGTSSMGESIAGPSAATISSALRAEMLEQFMKASGMKRDWSEKCLQDCDYDYTKAAAIFEQLRASGTIPPEAFESYK